VCAKFWEWLEKEHQDLFQTRHLSSIPMAFSALGFMVIGDPRTDVLTFDISLDISVEGHDENQECCQCNLFLVPVQGIPYPRIWPKSRYDTYQ
jgi:hypothetical protein